MGSLGAKPTLGHGRGRCVAAGVGGGGGCCPRASARCAAEALACRRSANAYCVLVDLGLNGRGDTAAPDDGGPGKGRRSACLAAMRGGEGGGDCGGQRCGEPFGVAGVSMCVVSRSCYW